MSTDYVTCVKYINKLYECEMCQSITRRWRYFYSRKYCVSKYWAKTCDFFFSVRKSVCVKFTKKEEEHTFYVL